MLSLFGLILNSCSFALFKISLNNYTLHKDMIKFMKGLFGVLFIVFISFSGFANNDNTNSDEKGGVVKGQVISQDGNPVPFASLLVQGTNKGTSSNEQGYFSLSGLGSGTIVIRISAVGFQTYSQEITLNAGAPVELVFELPEEAFAMPAITILADKDRLFSKIPGAASYISPKEMQQLAPISGNEVFRRVPGIHVVDEEGAGMRMNIGIRGLDPDRSRSVLVLEDGIPVALNPYGEPELYYTPVIDRMAGVEVVKGSGQVLYGPQTIGGVVNYITADPPAEQSANVRLTGGQGGYFSGLVGYGNTFGNTGLQVNYLRKQADNIGPTQFNIDNLTAKLKVSMSDKSSLGLKLGYHNEVSNSTYVGITQNMYDAGGEFDFVRIAPDDQLNVRMMSASAIHEYTFNKNLKLQTTAFAYSTTRNWRRQDFSYDPNVSNQTGVVWGDTEVPGGAIFMRNTTGNRDRQFEVMGFEPKITYNYDAFGQKSELITGVRYMFERAYEQRINGSKPDAISGTLAEDEVRGGKAYSAYAQNKINVTERLSLSGGLRFEQFNFERQINRGRYNNVITDTLVINNNFVTEIIPGAGINYRLAKTSTVYAGLHRGFAPPRVKDAIDNQGGVFELDAENSWNYELGTRTSLGKFAFWEVTAFMMDFQNQIIPVSESSGAGGAGLVNGGRTRHQGVETALFLGIGDMLNTGFKIDFDVNATFQQAFFSADRFVDGVNVNGLRTPYAPQTILSSALTLENKSGAGLRFTGTYIGDQFTDPANTIEASANGRIGYLPSYFLLDATAQYNVAKWNTRFFVSGKNLLNERYIASRRPQGIRVGLPRLITAGLEIRI